MTATARSPLPTGCRSPETVMRLERLGSFFPTRLSFLRLVLRRLSAEGSSVRRLVFDLDRDGYGRAVYAVDLGGHTYSLVAFSTPLDPDRRTDRVIAEAWDTSYVLYDGIPDAADLDRLAANAPRQEAGRYEPRDLVLSRANRSVRLFDHVVERLAAGQQPDEASLVAVGYLMRTTAVYGNGKFGIADRAAIAERPGLRAPFQAEMLTVWLIRAFTIDLVEHVAMARSPATAVPLDRRLKRHLGVGNATGLGMAPFLVNHPLLLDHWVRTRETALARVRAIESIDAAMHARVLALADRAQRHIAEWRTDDARQMARIETLRADFARFVAGIGRVLSGARPFDAMVRAADSLSIECQELVVALVLEPNGTVIDDLEVELASSAEPRLDPGMRVGALRDLLREHYAFALATDFGQPEAERLFWYVSEEKLEPRLGLRAEEPGAERELRLDIARQAKALYADLSGEDEGAAVATFLMRYPGHRQIVRRVQAMARHPYAEIRDNLIGSACLPIDMLRCKLSFFGAAKFDPKSDRWTRITLCQGAPLPDEIGSADADDWWLPVLGTA